MKPGTTEQLQSHVAELIAEGEEILKQVPALSGILDSVVGVRYVDLALFSRWSARCQHLGALLGEHANAWKDALLPIRDNRVYTATRLLGTLRAIEDTLKAGLLIRVEDLVWADAFADLLEQGDYLLSEGYHVAAGVLGRAVLEERLRNWCDRAGCMPSKKRPTAADYNAELYRAKHLDKLTMQHVTAMIAIGNDAAHVEPSLKAADVERLLRDVRDFLAQHPLS